MNDSNHDAPGKQRHPREILAAQMESAAWEIRDLRRQNEVLRAKVDTMDLFAAVLFATSPGSTQGFAEDAAWGLETTAKALRAEISDTAEPEPD